MAAHPKRLVLLLSTLLLACWCPFCFELWYKDNDLFPNNDTKFGFSSLSAPLLTLSLLVSIRYVTCSLFYFPKFEDSKIGKRKMTYTIKSFQPKGDILVYGNPSSWSIHIDNENGPQLSLTLFDGPGLYIDVIVCLWTVPLTVSFNVEFPNSEYSKLTFNRA